LKIVIPIKFTIPVINIGNLTVGGTGKTPHIEYLINLLNPYIKLAVLSRGYKRKTKGFRRVEKTDDVKNAGDEPLLFKRKYNDLNVFVSENRVEGISQMLMKIPDIQTVLLDDAFQHRSIDPALNILLTEYDYPFFNDFYLPSGRLREWRTGYKRADIIIVTKCPVDITEKDKENFISKIKLQKKQKIFFSYYKYFHPYFLYNSQQRIELKPETEVLLISALASTSYLIQYLESKVDNLHSLEFTDHHQFNYDDMENFKKIFDGLKSKNKIILTTEKDAMRLDMHRKFILDNKLPVFVLPVAVDFLFDQKYEFDELIKLFLLNFKS
jgi:tetraacyldisaccharide 4'-kinase